jgi:hypothetical protein
MASKLNHVGAAATAILLPTYLAVALREHITMNENLSKRPLPTIADLKRDLYSLPMSEKFQSMRSSDKDFSVSVSASFTSNNAAEAIEREFTARLGDEGWSIRDKRGRRTPTIHYCRLGTEASVEMRYYADIVYVNVALTYNAKSSDCPK